MNSLPEGTHWKTMFGYHGRYLRINLSTQTSEAVTLEEEVLRRFLGGSGLGTYLLLAEGAADCQTWSPDAALVFVFSPLVGSPLTTSAKFAVVSKSPLTGRINDSLASSHFAIAGKKTGFDAIVLVGQALEPSIVVIDEGQVSIQSAGPLWGMTCAEAEAALGERLDRGFQYAVIGPAGERRVRFATISHDGRHAGRGGSGAVLGAKNIKAVAVRGSKQTESADPQRLSEYAKVLSRKSFGPATAKYRELGTASNLLVFNRLSVLPTRNFQHGEFEGAVDLSPETLSATRDKTRTSCAGCTIGCEHLYSLGEGKPGVRLEYENLFAMGPLCGISDADAVLQASRRCDELGLDTISTGGVIAFAMECVERGLFDKPWLKFGDSTALLRAIESIGACDSLGRLLALGSRRMAEQIGGQSIEFAPQVKGLEIPGYEPRALQTMALGFAVGTRGADHNRSGAYEVDFSDQVDRRNVRAESVALAIDSEDRAAVIDSMILCKFLRGALEDFFVETAEMLHLVTGWDISAEELRETAARIVTLRKWFNVKAGWRPEEDTLPERFLADKLPEDERAVLSRERLGELIVAYNRQRGWSKDGWPTDEQVEALRLSLP